MNANGREWPLSKRRCRRPALLLFLSSFCLLPSAFSQVPLQFVYQGRLTDSNGVPVTGLVTGVFAVIRGGTALEQTTSGVTNYAETAVVVPDASGVFSHTVGTGTPVGGQTLDVSDFEGVATQRYVEVSFGGQNLLPRQPVVSVPYAMTSPGVVPVGAVLMWWGAFTNVPSGFEVCTGGVVTTSGSPLQGQPKPDLRDRFVMGAPTGVADVKSPVVTGGGNTISERTTGSRALEARHLPSHNHTASGTTGEGRVRSGVMRVTSNAGSGVNNNHVVGNGNAPVQDEPTDGTDFPGSNHDHDFSLTTSSVYGNGSGQADGHDHSIPAHDNRPAFLQMFYIIRVK